MLHDSLDTIYSKPKNYRQRDDAIFWIWGGHNVISDLLKFGGGHNDKLDNPFMGCAKTLISKKVLFITHGQNQLIATFT